MLFTHFSKKLTFILILTLLTIPSLLASEGHVAAIFSRNPVDSLMGGNGSYKTDFGKWTLEADGSIAHGDITESNANIAVGFDIGLGQKEIAIKPFTTLAAIRTSDWGYALDGGVKLNVPIGSLDVAIGAFARNSQAFVPLQHGTRNPVTGEIKWEDPTLLNFDGLGVWNAVVETGWDWKNLDLKLTGIVDLSNQKFHQLITDATASWDVAWGLQFSVMGQHIAQAGEGGGQQVNISSQIGYKF